jgi:hypothetical protein
MIWGDMGLAPGEGPDACNGINAERAKTIRESIPARTYVADWHYLNNPDPSVYKKNLQLWKRNQNIPLASPWLWPNNVHGFVKAAIDEQAGVLQTTWADFESSETNMLINIEQFGAYVLALDYAWSGRKELPDQLPYDPVKEWTCRFYDQSKPITMLSGYLIADSIRFRDITSRKNESPIQEYGYSDWIKDAIGIRFAGYTESILPEGSVVAEMEVSHDPLKPARRKPIRYGVEIRAKNDLRPLYAAMEGQDPRTSWHFWQGKQDIYRIQIKIKNPGSGLIVENLQFLR